MMHNEEELRGLLALHKRLMEESDMVGWLCTVHRNRVEYAGNPHAAMRIQAQLNKASNLVSLAYIWAVLEENGFNEHSKWIRPRDRLELKAWKHVRHTGAHAPSGRADRYRKEFDEFMASDVQGLSGLKQNCDFTKDDIKLKDGMSYRFFDFGRNLVEIAIGHCANNNEPVDQTAS